MTSPTRTDPASNPAANPAAKRGYVIAAVMASMAMVAIEATIVSTAMPQIVTQLGGLHLYSWVFSSFLLAQTAMTVVFGKLADLYGRKPVVLDRHRDLSGGLGARGLRVVDARDDRVPSDSGHRRGGDPAGHADHRRRPLSGARTRQGAGLSRERVGHRSRDRADGGRLHDSRPVVGVDLLDQRADRSRFGGRLHRVSA